MLTHAFNPFTFQPRLRPTAPCASSASPREIAWSADGSLLWSVLPQPCAEVADEVSEGDTADAVAGAAAAGGGRGSAVPALGAWGAFRGASGGSGRARRGVVCALDMTERSALSCARPRDWGREGDAAPFCMEWRQARLWGEEGADNAGGEGGVAAQFVEQGCAQVGDVDWVDGAVSNGTRRLGLARWPGVLEGGVALLREGVEWGSSVFHDRFENSVLVCGRSALQRVVMA